MQNGIAERVDKPKLPTLPSKLNSLSECQLKQVNEHVQKIIENTISSEAGKKHHHYNEYSAKERTDIGKYATETGVTKACRHFAKKLVPESTA